MARIAFLQNTTTGEVEEFAAAGDAVEAAIARNLGPGRDHWSMSFTRPEPLLPAVHVDMSDYVTPSHIRGSFDRNTHWNGEYARREALARANALDATLSRIAADDGVSRYLEAAE